MKSLDFVSVRRCIACPLAGGEHRFREVRERKRPECKLHAARPDGWHDCCGAVADKEEHGSLRRLLDGFQKRISRRDGETVRRVHDHRAPSAGARQAEERPEPAHFADTDGGGGGFVEHEKRWMRAGRYLPRGRRIERLGERACGYLARLLAQEKPRGAIGEGGFPDALLSREQPGMVKRAGRERLHEHVFGSAVTEQLRRIARMEGKGLRILVFAVCGFRTGSLPLGHCVFMPARAPSQSALPKGRGRSAAAIVQAFLFPRHVHLRIWQLRVAIPPCRDCRRRTG